MGSRSVVVVCRDATVARRRFGVDTGEAGVCYTRTGRRFFNDVALEQTFLDRVRAALDGSGFWDEHASDWACIDAELMPWSLKAQELLRDQYASVGAAARAVLPPAIAALESASTRGLDVTPLLDRARARRELANRYVDAYRRYCWPVSSVDDLRLAPFHLLATEGKVHVERDHVWHMETLAKVCKADPRLLVATQHLEL